jgi:hypothetical protein
MRMRANAQNAAKLKRRYSGEWHRGRRGREHRNRQQVGERRERAVSTVHRNVKILPNRFIVSGFDI